MNRVLLTGRLTKDPEVRYTSSGKAVCGMRLAVQQGKDTTFLNVKAWNQTAENCGKYLAKGSLIGADGSLHVNEFEKDGQKRTVYEVWADRVEFIQTEKKDEKDDPASDNFQEIQEAIPF